MHRRALSADFLGSNAGSLSVTGTSGDPRADLNLESQPRFVPNLRADNIIARTMYSPLDLEPGSPNSMVRGDVRGCAPFFYHTVGHRPTPDLGQYTLPGIERLYLVGPFMHPGGGVFEAGRATTIKMFEDLKLNCDRVARARP